MDNRFLPPDGSHRVFQWHDVPGLVQLDPGFFQAAWTFVELGFDRREMDAKVVGFDERTDVAVLKVEANNLPTVRIAQELGFGRSAAEQFTLVAAGTRGIVTAAFPRPSSRGTWDAVRKSRALGRPTVVINGDGRAA